MLQNSLIAAKKLTYFNLSGQPMHTLNFLPNQKSEAVALEVLILNDCVYLDENGFIDSILKRMSKINLLSLNRTKLCSNETVKLAVSLPLLFSLCVKGISLSSNDIIFIVGKCKKFLNTT